MISNDILSSFLLFMLALSILCFTILFALFIYKELGGVKFGRDSFLFFDYIFFCSGMKPNISALSVFFVFLFGVSLDYNLNTHFGNSLGDILWGVGIVLFFIHCRFYSNLEYKKNRIAFIRELFLNMNIQPRLIFLWLARVLFVILIVNRFS